MARIVIPIPEVTRATGSSTQRTKLSGREYSLRFQWNQRAAHWTLDLADQDDVMIVAGLVLAVGWPLLSLVTDVRRPPGELAVFDPRPVPNAESPTLESLGTRHELIYWEP